MPSVMKTLILANTALMLSAGVGTAQTSSPSPPTLPPSTAAPGSTTPSMTNPPKTAALPADRGSRGVVGLRVKGPNDKTVGKIDNVILSSDGKVNALIVDVGGVLGVGGKDVLVDLSDISIDGPGDRVTTTLTEDQLKAKPEYRVSPTRSTQ